MMSGSLRLELALASGLRSRIVVVPTYVLLVSDYCSSFCTYPTSCLEEVFSETGLPVSERLKNSPPLGVTRPAKGDKEEETP